MQLFKHRTSNQLCENFSYSISAKHPSGPSHLIFLVCFIFCMFHRWDTLHHFDALRHEMALSHFPLLRPRTSSLNYDVDQQLILFPFLEPVAGAGRRDTTTRRCRNKESHVCVIVWGCATMRSLFMSLRVYDGKCVCLSLLVYLPSKHIDKGLVWVYSRLSVFFYACVSSKPPTSFDAVTSPL